MLQDHSAPDRAHYFWTDALAGHGGDHRAGFVSIFGLYGFEHILANWAPTRLLWAGHQAVILFFVISGFALYLLMWVVAITASIGLAWPFYLAVEQPSKAASRAVRAWFAPPAP